MASLRHTQHSKTQPAAKISKPCVALSPVSPGRDPRRQPNLITGCGSIDGLKDEFEIEPEFHLSDDNKRRLVASKRDEIAAAYFTLNREPEAFEKSFDGCVKGSLQG
jgi:hypothetical protein